MSKEILLSRHGEDEDNANPEGRILNGRRNRNLTEVGRKQSLALGEYLKESGFVPDVILTSPLARAQQTAEIVAECLELYRRQIQIWEILTERDFGPYTGLHNGDIKKVARTLGDEVIETQAVDYFNQIHSAGESFPVLFERAITIVDTVRQRYGDKSVLIVSHGDIGKMILAVTHGYSWKEMLTLDFHFGNTDAFILFPENTQEPPQYYGRKMVEEVVEK